MSPDKLVLGGLLLLGIPAGGGLAICTGALCYAWCELLKLL